jgi:hypothetical protein
MTDHELDTALRALTEVDADPALAGRVLARLEQPAPTVRMLPWLGSAAAALVLGVIALSWYAGRPPATPRVPDAPPFATAAALGVPRVPDPALAEDASDSPIVPASFRRGSVGSSPDSSPYRIPAIGRAEVLGIPPIDDAPLRGTRLAVAPLEVVEIIIPALDRQ